MPAPVKIEPFQPADLAQILEIEAASFPGDPYTGDLFLRYHRRCPDGFLVARHCNCLAGYIITCRQGSRAEIISVAVAPERRRAGIGGALLHHALVKLAGAGVATVGLMVRATDCGAIAFYRKFGFQEAGMVNNYYADGADALRMSKRLAAP